MTVLALSYRPVTFSDVVGQAPIKAVLQAMVRTGQVPPALIFGGSRGTGKTTCARIMAAALNCDDQKNGDACGICPSCKGVQATVSSSVLEIDAASNGGVEEIRKIKDICSYAHEGTWRVVLLDEAHSMSREAFNALLKLLEEPPPGTLFVLLTTEVHKILETVRSRSMAFEFRRLSPADIIGRLQHIAATEKIDADPALLSEIAQRCQGGMRDAVMLLDQVSRVGISTVEAYRDLFGITDIAVPLLTAALAGDLPKGAALIEDAFTRTGDASGVAADLVSLVRDLLTLKAGATLSGMSPEAVAARQGLVERTPQSQLATAIRVLWELKPRVRATEDDQLASMHMAYVLLTEALHRIAPGASAADTLTLAQQTPAPQQRMTLAEMRLRTGQQRRISP